MHSKRKLGILGLALLLTLLAAGALWRPARPARADTPAVGTVQPVQGTYHLPVVC